MAVENPLCYGTGLSALSPEQLSAATHEKGSCLVIAGPGSGKTLTITYRLQHLISGLKLPPSSILTITFTRAAALEMAARAGKLLSDMAAALNIGTFHSIFYKILRNTYRFSSDNIIRNTVKSSLLKEILESLHIELRDRTRTVTGLLNEISRVKCSLDEGSGFESAYLERAKFDEVFKRYKKRMSELRLIDFDDMMLLSLDLFKEREKVLKKWQENFRYIQVDEFQDVDPVQYELLKLLAGEDKNLFAVGDDDQSIYGFRGAEPRIMSDFEEDFPDAALIKLTVNYRSDSGIVRAAGLVIAENKTRFEKEIVSGSALHSECALDIREFKDRTEEIDAFRSLIRDTDINKAAVLLRTNELMSFYAERLSGLNIGFKCRDKIKNVYEHFIAQDILAYLSLADGNMRRRELFKVMNRPFRGISRNAAARERFDEKMLLHFHSGDIGTSAAIRRLFRDLALLSKMKPYAAVHYILHGMGYEKFLKNYAIDKGLDTEELIRIASEIKEAAAPYKSYRAWREAIDEYALTIEKLNSSDVALDDEDGVSLLTMHGSKGLEFDEVFIFDVNETIIPYHKAVLPQEIEEERRLFYVAMTRARKKLHIFSIRDNMGKKLNQSRFLEALPGNGVYYENGV